MAQKNSEVNDDCSEVEEQGEEEVNDKEEEEEAEEEEEEEEELVEITVDGIAYYGSEAKIGSIYEILEDEDVGDGFDQTCYLLLKDPSMEIGKKIHHCLKMNEIKSP